MAEDEVMRSVRAAKEALGARYGFDVRRLAEAMRAREALGGRKVVPPPEPPRRPTAQKAEPHEAA